VTIIVTNCQLSLLFVTLSLSSIMDSDDITLEPQATSEYDSAVVETENHNEDAAQNTETLG